MSVGLTILRLSDFPPPGRLRATPLAYRLPLKGGVMG